MRVVGLVLWMVKALTMLIALVHTSSCSKLSYLSMKIRRLIKFHSWLLLINAACFVISWSAIKVVAEFWSPSENWLCTRFQGSNARVRGATPLNGSLNQREYNNSTFHAHHTGTRRGNAHPDGYRDRCDSYRPRPRSNRPNSFNYGTELISLGHSFWSVVSIVMRWTTSW